MGGALLMGESNRQALSRPVDAPGQGCGGPSGLHGRWE